MSYIQSPLHSHILSLRHLSPHYQAYNDCEYNDCGFCKDQINGSTSVYCCEKCECFIHTSCALSFPPQIQHPRHKHPLEFQELHAYYRCVRGCKYKLYVVEAMTTLQVEKYYCWMLREASDGESRLQFAHDHPLTTFPVRTGISCRGCKIRISEEEAYGCSECRFFLHEACAKAPLEIRHHPFHPKHPLYLSYDSSCEGYCRACACRFSYDMYPIRYRCEECKLSFHLSCVISTMPRDDDDGEREDISRRPSVIDHPLHPHQLSSYHSKTDTRFSCSICRERISSENFFGCLDCSFFLHKSCAQRPIDAIQHYFHPEHTLTLIDYHSTVDHECAICESKIIVRGSYYCQMCDLLIHQSCASATLSDLEKGVARTVQYPFHEHKLELYCNIGVNFCTVCDRNICKETLAYKCFKGCQFKLHKSCLQLSSHLEHPSHSLHALTLCFPPPNRHTVCRRCNKRFGGRIDGRNTGTFAFSCGECNFYLHVDCAQIPTTLKHPFHEHHLFYFSRNEKYGSAEGRQDNRMCRACHKSCRIDFFSCTQCDYTLHYECSQLPPTIKSEHHSYCEPLVLRESFIEDERAEYYCDICERRRDPKRWVYFCENCDYNFVAHVECALSPVKVEVIEEHDFIKGEDDIQKLEEEIRDAQEQVDAEKERLRPLMEKLKSMREKVELQWMELEKRKAEHAKWINMGVIKEDKSIKGEEDKDSTYGKSKKLKTILEKLNTEQANWLIDFLKTECNWPTAFFSWRSFSSATSQSEDETTPSTENDDEGDEIASSKDDDYEGDETAAITTSEENDDKGDDTTTSKENDNEGDVAQNDDEGDKEDSIF